MPRLSGAFFAAAWGPVALWMAEVSTEGGRTLVIHPLTSGENFPVQDRGKKLKITRAELLFDEMDGEDITPQARFAKFDELVNQPEPQVFTHPLLGSFLARVGDFDHRVNDNGTISATCQFVPVEPIRPVSTAGAGTSAVAGDGAVSAAAGEMTAQLAANELTSDMPASATAAIASWSEALTTPTRQILVDVGSISDRVNEGIARLDLVTDLALWPSYKATIILADAVRAAGDAATSEIAALFTLRVERPISLRALVAGIYGGFDADRYYDIARQMNDIVTPAWIPSGTELRLPQRPADPRRG